MKITNVLLMISKICSKTYFTFFELKCKCGCDTCNVNYDALKMLIKTRVILDKPIILNSAYRCKLHNAAIGSKTSNHTSGKAFDIECNDGLYRLQLIKALLAAGFKRIIIYDNFIHTDCNQFYPSGLWIKMK